MKKQNKGYIKGGPKSLVDVKLDDTGKAAEAFLNLKSEKDKTTKDLNKAEGRLVAELKKAKRTSITIAGITLSINVVEEKTKIKVAKG